MRRLDSFSRPVFFDGRFSSLFIPLLVTMCLAFGCNNTNGEKPVSAGGGSSGGGSGAFSVLKTTPTDGDTSVFIDASIFIETTEELDPASINVSSVRVEAAGVGINTTTGLTDPRTIHVKITDNLNPMFTNHPQVALDFQTTYKVTIKGTVAATTGATLGSDVTFSFTTADLIQKPGVDQVSINELHFAPEGTDLNKDGVNSQEDEFIEILNHTDAYLDLQGYFVTELGGTGTEYQWHSFPAVADDLQSLVAPNKAVVIFSRHSPPRPDLYPVRVLDANRATGSGGFNNSGDTVSLLDGPPGLGVIIDQVAYTTNPAGDGSWNSNPDGAPQSQRVVGTPFVDHSAMPGTTFDNSAGTQFDGTKF